MDAISQRIRYLTTDDGDRIAWAESGSGPPLVKASNWITHLEYELESPVWKHWIRFLSEHFSTYRYDERGCGLSERRPKVLKDSQWLADLDAVVKRSKVSKPFTLLGISQGACAAIEYAVKYPEHLSQLVIYGGYSKGYSERNDPRDMQIRQATLDLMTLCWGKSDPAFRRVFTTRFLPEGTPEQMDWFDELLLRSIDADVAKRLLEHRGTANVSHLLEQVTVPTLVIHANEDDVVPITAGQEIAARIPDAQFVEVDSKNHILLESEPAWRKFQECVLDFTNVDSRAENPVFESLTDREREILSHLVKGQTNSQIGQTLFISEKTVRNNATRIFEKLGVSSRTQAMAFARDNGFQS